MAVRVTLPALSPWQKEVEECNARFIVCVCGRRSGKTTYGVRKCVRCAMETGGLYFWIAPSYKVAQTGWDMLKKFARQIPGTEIREADKQVILPNGGRIDVRSAVDPDSLRGEKVWGAVFDEFAWIKEETWSEVIRPSLTDVRGWAMFIGTPAGNNWAKRLFDDAKLKKDWAQFHLPSTSNPFIPKEEIEAARQDMTEAKFRQEYEADFGAAQYSVYETSPRVHRWSKPIPEFVGYYGGMDFAGDTVGAHMSATAIAGKTAQDELILIASFKQSGPNIAERQLNWAFTQQQTLEDIHRAARKRPPTILYRGDRSQPVGIQFMRRMGLNVFPSKGGTDSVSEGIQMVQRRLQIREDGKPRLYWLPGLYDVEKDFGNYRYPEPKNDGTVEAKNPLKVDDDLMDAIRYLVEGTDRGVLGDPRQLYGNQLPQMAGSR